MEVSWDVHSMRRRVVRRFRRPDPIRLAVITGYLLSVHDMTEFAERIWVMCLLNQGESGGGFLHECVFQSGLILLL